MATPDTLMAWLEKRLDNHESRFAERMAALEEKVGDTHECIASHMAREETCWDDVEKLKVAVWGNGTAGHNIRLDRLEQWRNRLHWVATAILIPAVLYVGYVLLQKVML